MNKIIDDTKLKEAAKQINLLQKQVDYDTRDYPIKYLVDGFETDLFVIPNYQRKQSIWPQHDKERFIESLILGYPIPLIFLSDTEDGQLEIVDGLQRITTLKEFINDELTLKKMDKLTSLKSFKFTNLPLSEQRRLKAKPLRVIVLRKSTDEETRIDLFNRINTSGTNANPAEIRGGSQALNKFMVLIKELANHKTFLDLVNLSDNKLKRQENVELVSRFFAFAHNYKKFQHNVGQFVDEYIKITGENFKSNMKKTFSAEFKNTINYISHNYPQGVFKNANGQTPRVRFEALTVGTFLALQENNNLEVDAAFINEMVATDEFKILTTSDGSNSLKRVTARIEFVKEYLLSGEN
ncbi:DUF262 domain-containing protein [Lactobacillus sp. CBA3605]|uniref:DUF262 domain-containing protein n=1 Tax=Lactobacillus sp. CBA3605 TaxID=2099788 RepID=UPI00131A2372|nr:DUF262 domain-containing protein [Lactobacillus sp. CBA3605]